MKPKYGGLDYDVGILKSLDKTEFLGKYQKVRNFLEKITENSKNTAGIQPYAIFLGKMPLPEGMALDLCKYEENPKFANRGMKVLYRKDSPAVKIYLALESGDTEESAAPHGLLVIHDTIISVERHYYGDRLDTSWEKVFCDVPFVDKLFRDSMRKATSVKAGKQIRDIKVGELERTLEDGLKPIMLEECSEYAEEIKLYISLQSTQILINLSFCRETRYSNVSLYLSHTVDRSTICRRVADVAKAMIMLNAVPGNHVKQAVFRLQAVKEKKK